MVDKNVNVYLLLLLFFYDTQEISRLYQESLNIISILLIQYFNEEILDAYHWRILICWNKSSLYVGWRFYWLQSKVQVSLTKKKIYSFPKMINSKILVIVIKSNLEGNFVCVCRVGGACACTHVFHSFIHSFICTYKQA